ncbi:MAG: hypothetical protein GY820_14220, partial [Gammaproteobacteria bacterium]|nr:hypothetical protein [Gammaproteobacteria bacterium]
MLEQEHLMNKSLAPNSTSKNTQNRFSTSMNYSLLLICTTTAQFQMFLKFLKLEHPYADDTKIWRSILTESDNNCLQKDIDYLHDWALRNKMKFHPSKCEVLSVTGKIPETLALLSVLPFYNFVYSLGGELEFLEHVDSEKDLGVMVATTLDWAEQCAKLYSKANQKLGMARRNCHFVIDKNRRRVLYLTLVRSQFEHCSVIWRPVTKTLIEKLEGLQKRAIKWILREEYISYTFNTYIQK